MKIIKPTPTPSTGRPVRDHEDEFEYSWGWVIDLFIFTIGVIIGMFIQYMITI
jgi:hypothetical protein